MNISPNRPLCRQNHQLTPPSQRRSHRPTDHGSLDNLSHRRLRPIDNLRNSRDIRRLPLEPLRTPPPHPTNLPLARNPRRNVLRRSRFPLQSTSPLHRPELCLRRNGSRSTMSQMGQYPSWRVFRFCDCYCDLSLELCDEADDVYYCSEWMVGVLESDDGDCDCGLFLGEEAELPCRGFVHAK